MAPRIDQRLLERLKEKLNLGQAATYARIAKRAGEEKLPPHLAAIDLASDLNINITRYASSEQLAELRGGGGGGHLRTASALVNQDDAPRAAPKPPREGRGQRNPARKKGNRVFVVHGRNEMLRKAMFQFLRAAGVQPIEWSKAISYARSASPHVSDILEPAFSKAQAVVVMFTPDDEAKLKDEFLKRGDPRHERRLTGQPRQNVLFEAGMAFGTHPRQTVLVEFGNLRPISDLIGRHAVRMDNSVDKRQELMIKLQNTGCEVDFQGSDWRTDGDLKL